MRDTTLTTANVKAIVDFCVDRNMQYVEFDTGWYDPERDVNTDATKVICDAKRLDMQEVIRYAKSKNIEVWLYVNNIALHRQLDDILPLYESWGVCGVKYGFVDVGDQESTIWLHNAIRKAAEHHLMVDIHDEYRSTGWEWTCPNLLTVEGVRGNEEMPPSWHNCTASLVFLSFGKKV